MTEADRDRLRALQDRWLDLPTVQHQIRIGGEDEHITGNPFSPTFREVRTIVFQKWEAWFKGFFQE